MKYAIRRLLRCQEEDRKKKREEERWKIDGINEERLLRCQEEL